MRRLSLLVVVALACGALAAAPRATQLARDADKLYREGKYREAAEALKQAYALDQNPVVLFNIARAYDQAGELQVALDTYRQYVALPDTDPQLLNRANLAMDRLRKLLADKQVADAEARRLKDEAEAANRKAAEEAEASRRQRDEFERKEATRKREAARGTSARRVVAISIGAAALAGAGVGVGFAVLANGSKRQFTAAITLADKQAAERSTRQNALIADIGLACALAFGVTFAVLFPWAALGGEGPGAVSVALTPRGLALGGGF